MQKSWPRQTSLNDHTLSISPACGAVLSLPCQSGASDLSTLTRFFPSVPAVPCPGSVLLPVAVGLLVSRTSSPWGQSPSPARSGAGVARTDPLSSSVQIMVRFSSVLHRMARATFFLSWKCIADAAVISLVCLRLASQVLCWKMAVVLIFCCCFSTSQS